MFDTNMKMTFSLVNDNGEIDAKIAVKDLTEDVEYEASASGDDVEEVLTNLCNDILDSIDTNGLEDMDEDDYIDYLESRIEELEIENEVLREKNQNSKYSNKIKYKTIDDIIEDYFSKYIN